MPPQYTITINNQSGRPQNYMLANRPPKVMGVGPPKVVSTVHDTAEYTPPGGMASFTVTKDQYFGMVGKVRGGLKPGSQVSIGQACQVQVGKQQVDGTVEAGSTLKMQVLGGTTAAFEAQLFPSEAFAGCFEIITRDNFTLQDALNNNMFVGLASSNWDPQAKPIAAFTPEPNVRYQIEPSNVWCVTFGGSFRTGDIVELSHFGALAEVDFTRQRSQVMINHTENGRLVVQN